MKNPLLQEFQTPLQSVPFEDIQQEHYEPAMSRAIELAKEEIQKIVEREEEPDFKNVIEALEKSGMLLNQVSSIFFNLCAAETNDYLEKLQERLSPKLAEFGNDITLNTALFQKVKTVFDQKAAFGLNKEEERLLDKTYKSFTRNGALLTEAEKETLRAIDQELALLTVKFAQNVLQETNAYFLHIQDESVLEGLPQSAKEQAKQEAKERQLAGWVFTLHYPSFVPFMKYMTDRELRREMHLAAGRKAFQDNEWNNEENIRKIVALRERRAKLLGFQTHAHFVLEERMAETPETVSTFLTDLLEKATPFGQKEIENLRTLAKEDEIASMMPYDHAFYAEKKREQTFDYSEEELRPYFPLHQVLAAAFEVANRLYGLEFRERNDLQKYHEEVQAYEVLENGQHKALLYTDWHPRKGKRPGAWMTSYRGQWQDESGNHRPHIAIVCNFSRPTKDEPSLLTFQEVTTLFHEFGHALHGILADTTYESLSGTNVYWDFVELPSQFMENYCYDKTFLDEFARHYQTGEKLPEEMIDKIVASANFLEGYQTLRQLSFGFLDLAYHTGQLRDIDSIADFEETITRGMQLYPRIEGTAQSPAFSHIFAGGYSAGYYSYKWSEVLDADAFAYFKENGIFDKTVASKFKRLLSKGGTENPMDLYVEFRGRKPDSEALLRRAGLVEKSE